MPSKYFTPGRTNVHVNVNSFNAFASYNQIPTENIFKNYFPCNCNNIVKDPTTLDGYSNVSRNQIRANTIKSSIGNGGKIGFGNYNFGGNTSVNYLGRVEGQNGGGGRPIRNQFA